MINFSTTLTRTIQTFLCTGCICFFTFYCDLYSTQAEQNKKEISHKVYNDFSIPAKCEQLILCIAPNWNTSHATLSFWERNEQGFWEKKIQDWPARLGRNGLAWGRGISEMTRSGSGGKPIKRSGDGRSPAGVFELGDAYGYASSFPTQLAYHQVTEKDLWVEDGASKFYNAHAFTPHGKGPRNAWEKKQQMKQNDHAHSLKLFIKHNASPDTIPGMGCSLFFHIWRRDGALPSSGCVVMPEHNLKKMLQALDPSKEPLLALFSKDVYRARQKDWRLPSLE